MDVFKIEQSLGALGSGPSESQVTAEVTFDTTSDFNLSFFDTSSSSTPATVALSGSHCNSAILKEDYDDLNPSPQSCHDQVFDPLGSDGLFSPPPVTPPSPGGGGATIKTEYEPNRSAANCNLLQRRKGHGGVNNTPLTLFSPPAHLTSSSSSSIKNAGSVFIKTEPGFALTESNSNSTGTSNSSSSSSSSSKSFVPCKVCGDKASGYHYGVTSCEGCKGFFRRSIQKQIEYRCLRDGKCLVIRLNRNRCQYCRFKKCLAVGMSRDSVRYGRVPKRSRERGASTNGEESIRSPGFADPATPDSSDSCSAGHNATPTIRDPESRQLAIYDTILTVSQAHHTHCAYTEEKIRAITPSAVSIPAVDGKKDISEEQLRLATWSALASHVTPSIQRVVEFAKRVPGFVDLSQDDQLILIKIGFFEVWLGHVSRSVHTGEGTLVLADGTTFSRQQLELIFDADFIKMLFKFAEGLNHLAINDSEMALFSAAVLLCPERQGINDAKLIGQHQEKITDALRLQLLRNHASEPNLIASLLQKMTELKHLGSRHQLQLDWYRHRWNMLQLPPLFAEMFDITRGDEELA